MPKKLAENLISLRPFFDNIFFHQNDILSTQKKEQKKTTCPTKTQKQFRLPKTRLLQNVKLFNRAQMKA